MPTSSSRFTPSWKPNVFERSCFGTTLHFTFPVIKLLELDALCKRLLPGTNPFAWVVRAHLDNLATRGDGESRLLRKKEVYRSLHAAGFARKTALDVIVFFDWVLALPQELAPQFDTFLKKLEATMGKPYVPTWERAREEGIQQGVQQGIQQGIQRGEQRGMQQAALAKTVRVLEKRLPAESATYVATVAHLTEAERDELFDLLIDTTDAETIREWFRAHPVKSGGN